MTLEHKILTLIDRGVTSIDDIGRILEPTMPISDALVAAIFAGQVARTRHGGECVTLTAKGLDRLNELDEAEATPAAPSQPPAPPE